LEEEEKVISKKSWKRSKKCFLCIKGPAALIKRHPLGPRLRTGRPQRRRDGRKIYIAGYEKGGGEGRGGKGWAMGLSDNNRLLTRNLNNIGGQNTLRKDKKKEEGCPIMGGCQHKEMHDGNK